MSNGWVTIPLSIFFVLFCSCVLQASVFFSGGGGGGGGWGVGNGVKAFFIFLIILRDNLTRGGGGAPGCRERGEGIFLIILRDNLTRFYYKRRQCT